LPKKLLVTFSQRRRCFCMFLFLIQHQLYQLPQRPISLLKIDRRTVPIFSVDGWETGSHDDAENVTITAVSDNSEIAIEFEISTVLLLLLLYCVIVDMDSSCTTTPPDLFGSISTFDASDDGSPSPTRKNASNKKADIVVIRRRRKLPLRCRIGVDIDIDIDIACCCCCLLLLSVVVVCCWHRHRHRHRHSETSFDDTCFVSTTAFL
jgi:hypothetical protein